LNIPCTTSVFNHIDHFNYGKYSILDIVEESLDAIQIFTKTSVAPRHTIKKITGIEKKIKGTKVECKLIKPPSPRLSIPHRSAGYDYQLFHGLRRLSERLDEEKLIKILIEVASFFPETAPKSGHEQKKQEESNWKSLNFQSFFILKKTKINEIHHIRIVV
uniref:Uncharacterized protein n=1 Tax=Dracunculus medinensis TaxID=318479 RepID=A0A0N4ULV6_DRAME